VDDVYQVITAGRAEAVCLASILHYNFIRSYDTFSGDYSVEGNTEFLKKVKEKGFSMIQDAALSDIKSDLAKRQVDCRWPVPA
jgi:hypothetical protein